MDMRRLVGRNLARVRRGKGWTQEQLQERSGFSQQYISGVEKGHRNPTVVTVYELALALGVSHLELLTPDADVDEQSADPGTAAGSRQARRR